MTTLHFTVKEQNFTIEVPDGFEVVVAGDKITVRSNYTYVPPVQQSLPWTFPYTQPIVTFGGVVQGSTTAPSSHFIGGVTLQ